MSLILDALRKMEQERKSRKGAATGIRAEVLRYRAAVRQPQARPYLVVGVIVGLTLAGIGAGFLWKGEREPQATPALQAAGTSGSEAMEKKAPAPLEAVTQPQPAAQAAGVRAEAPVAAPAPPESAAPATPAAPKAAPKAVARSKAARPEAAARPQAQALPREAALEAPAVLPDITISGIAYQDERNLRRAVLNGVLVGEGAEIAGARVVEIKENKVRMSRGGQLFEVLFSSGLNSR